jgi:hypothetical protein
MGPVSNAAQYACCAVRLRRQHSDDSVVQIVCSVAISKRAGVHEIGLCWRIDGEQMVGLREALIHVKCEFYLHLRRSRHQLAQRGCIKACLAQLVLPAFGGGRLAASHLFRHGRVAMVAARCGLPSIVMVILSRPGSGE